MTKWLQIIGLNLGGAAAGLAGTWLIVWLFGLANYADYLIDLAKISILLLLLEVLPSGYSLFRQQRDEAFAAAYPAFYAFMAIVLPISALGLTSLGFFERPNLFLVAYAGLAVIQRYYDCQLQAAGYLAAYYRIPAFTNLLRFIFLGSGAFALGVGRESTVQSVGQLLWGSLASALFLSLVLVSYRHRSQFVRLFVACKRDSFIYLWSKRQAYHPYYLNSVLKRAKDTMLPLLLDVCSVDRVLTGLILVYAKSFEVIAGQLRLIEAAFTNLLNRASLAASRSRIAYVAAAVGQPACVAVAGILLWREGLEIESILPAIIVSFGVYPYVFEVLARNDALAAEHPRKVTISLVVYVAVLGVGMPALSSFGYLTPMSVMVLFLIALIGASISYQLRGRVAFQ